MAMNNYKLGIKAKINSKLGVLAQFQLGCIHERRKEFKQSIYYFKQCLLYDQSHFGACIHLATQLANSNEMAKAEKYFRHCLKLNPTSVPVHFGLGKVLHQYGDHQQEALQHY